ncbi:MAG TPA: cellulose synthase operon protein YhjQ/BcsQ [Acidobacteriaceae bacterium]|nr:cellulose synthase operon protein YhjQ/BcsQ [Acidobacteriaceae bacterium]
MGSRGTEIDDSTPADVSALFSWANLQGAKYRDYSAARREQRAQARYQAAKEQLDKELSEQAQDETAGGANARTEAARRAEAAALAALAALREEREMAEARQSAQVKAQLYEEAGQRRRALAGPQPLDATGGELVQKPVLSEMTWPMAAEPEAESAEAESGGERIRPAWLEVGWVDEEPAIPAGRIAVTEGEVFAPSIRDTLLDSREQVASRWRAMKGIFAGAETSLPAIPMRGVRGPLVAIYSPSGGVGRTSLAATLARALAGDGERVLLVETSSDGLLKFYFGLTELRAGEVREAALPEEVRGTVKLAAYDLSGVGADDRAQAQAVERILALAEGCDRVVMDGAPGAMWLVRRVAALRPLVLAPMAPDMNSVVAAQAMERAFSAVVDREGRPVLPVYVLNRFDSGLPLHLDVRELFRSRLGGRLLPVSVRRSAAVSEAMADGATVVDYAPELAVNRDYQEIAMWVEETAPAAAEAFAGAIRSRP